MNYIKQIFNWNRGLRAQMQEPEDTNDSIDGLTADPLSASPHKAWKKLKPECQVEKLKPMPASTPISENSIRFVCIADTHVRLERKGCNVHEVVPPGDVLLHAGDFSMDGTSEEISLFNESFGNLPHPVKILIAGNHEMSLDAMICSKEEADQTRSLLTNFIYLQDATLELCGVTMYGSPWTPDFGHCWGFSRKRGAPLLRRWNMIPDNVDILMTHGPPLGYGDTVFDGYSVGCVDLLNTVRQRVHPKYHIYGHIHEGYGMRTDGQTVFINAAMCTKRYRPLNAPIVFDYPIPPGHTKQELKDVVSSSLKRFAGNVRDDVQEKSGEVHKAEHFMKYSEGRAEVQEEVEDENSIF